MEVRSQTKQSLVGAHDDYIKNVLDTTVNKKPKWCWLH